MPLSRQYLVVIICAALGITGLFLQVSGVFSSAKAQNQSRSDAGAVAVETAIIGTKRMAETRDAVGTARAYHSILVTPKISGVIEAIDFQEGQLVKEGDFLIQLNRAEKIADKEKAQAELLKAEAQRDEATYRLERATALRKTGSGTAAQVDDITAQVRAFEGAVASAKAAIRAADARIDDLIIRAPFSGRVGSRNFSVGAYPSPGNSITTLDDLSVIRLDFSVPESLLDRLKVGQVVRALSAAYPEREFIGTVSVIDTRIDPTSRSVRLTADFDNTGEVLKTGMFLSVKLEVANNEEAVIVPEEALVSDGMKHIIFIIGADNKAERRIVQIGQRQRKFAEILDGAKAGETVVVRGVQRVRPGITVDPKPILDAVQKNIIAPG